MNIKKFLVFFVLGVLFISVFAPLPVTATPSASLEDWVDSDFGNRIKITFPSDTEISADVNAVPILLKFEGSDNVYWQNKGDDDANDSKFYGYPASGSGFGTTPTELDYEIIDYNESAYRYHVFVNVLHLEDGTDTGNYIYMYTDYTGSGDFDDPSGVWGTSAKYIGHFITNANDSSANANNGTVSGATLTEDSNYLGGYCYSFDDDNDYISLGTLLQGATAITIITTVYSDSSSSSSYPIFVSNRKVGTNEDGTFAIYYSEVGGVYAGYIYDSGARTPTKIANDDERVFVDWRWVSNTSNIIRVNTSGTGLSSNFGNTTIGATQTYIGCDYAFAQDFKGKIGFMWIFSDVKSDDWIKAVYNNQENYSSFVTVGSIETYPTVEFTYPTATTYNRPLSLDLNVTINGSAGMTMDEANFSYKYDGIWYDIKNNVNSSDADVLTWTSSAISWRWDSTNSFFTEAKENVIVQISATDNGINIYEANSAEFDITFNNSAPNAPTITSVGGVTDVNGTVYDEATGNNTYLLNLKGYNASDPDGDNMTHRWSWDTVYETLFTTPDNNTAWLDDPADINSSTITDALTRNTTIYIGLMSKDDYADANTSTFWKVTVENRVPSAPVVTDPTGETYDTTPEITWNASTDGDGDDFNYCVVIKDSAENVDYNSTFLSTVASGIDSDTLTVDSYNVYVYVYDGWDTNVSSAGSFSVIENTVPNKPTITSIGNSDTNGTIYDEDTSTSGIQITRKGYNSSDYDHDTQNFKWEVDDNSDFSSPEITVDSLSSSEINGTFTDVLTRNTVYYFRLGAIDPAGANDYNYSSTIFKMTFANRNPTKPVVTAPSGEIYDTTPSITWNASTDGDGDTLTYRVEISNASGVIRQSAWGVTSPYTNSTDLSLGDYNATVIVNDGTETNSSNVSSFSLIVNTVPNKPIITTIGGENNSTKTIYDEDSGATFQITLHGYNSSDYDHDPQYFKWDVDDASDFLTPLFTVDSLGSADINRTMTTALTKNAYYWFRLGAIDPAGANDYNYSTPFYMYLANRTPVAGSLSSPINASYITDTTPTFDWNASSDDDGDSLTYQVRVYDTLGNLDYNNSWGSGTDATPPSALDLDSYSWLVVSYDGYDYTNSSTWTFTILNSRPNKAYISSIAGESNASIVYDQDPTAGFKLSLDGTNSSDSDGDNQKWAWLIDDNASFSSIDYNTGFITPIDYDFTTELTKNMDWYFRIDSTDPLGSGEVNSSEIWKETLNNVAPNPATVTTPTDMSEICDLTVYLEWSGSDDDGDSLTYQVRVYDTLGNLDYNNSWGSETNSTTTTLLEGVYSWLVVSYDGYDYTNSSTWTFTAVENAIPSVPVPSTPSNYSKDVDPVGTVLDWEDSIDSCGDTITYTVQWTTDYTFTHYQETTTSSSTYLIPTELYTEQVYYWRVKATDVIGSTAWSSIYEFQTESASGGSGSDQYEVRANGAYDKDSGRVEVVVWIQKNGVMMTGITDVSVVMKDDANTTVHTFNSGTVYSDGFYRETWTTTGLHGIYSLKTTLTYSGNTYYGGSYFDAGIMEIHDALDSMTTTINLIQGYTDSLEANMSTVMTYIGDPSDTSSDSTLFGYSTFLKDKWGSYTAEQIYNKVDDVYGLVSDINSTDIAYLRSTLDDLDTYVRTYAGVDIAVGSTYDFYNDQLEISVAYVHEGDIQNTASCTTVVKDSDGTVIKTFTSAEDADYVYRYEWNSSAVDYPTNGFTGAYTVIPSVVYNGNTFTTVSTFSAELPDLYGVTEYDDDLVPYSDSGYSVQATSIMAGSYVYVKGTGSTTPLPDLTSVSWTLWWEDTYNNVLATSTGSGAISSNTLRMPTTVPSGISGTVHLRLYAYKTSYGHRMTEISGVSDDFTVQALAVGSGLPKKLVSCEIRECPDTVKYGNELPMSLYFARYLYVPDNKEPVAFDVKIKSGEASLVTKSYTISVGKEPEATTVAIPTKSNILKNGGTFTVEVSSDGLVLDSAQISINKVEGGGYGWLFDPIDFPEVGYIVIPVLGGLSLMHLLIGFVIYVILRFDRGR